MAPRREFAVFFDYRCPFARIAHEHVLDGLDEGADWDVRFQPFSLSAAKDPTWDRAQDTGLLALELAVAVRDTQPEHFLAAHRALFTHRHDRGGNLRDLESLAPVLADAGVDVAAALAEVESGLPLKTVRAEHEAAVNEHEIWGVPAFVAGGQAAFVRLMERPADAAVRGAAAIDRILDTLVGWPELNEFKHFTLPR
ncbi:MAG: protein-disulfide isomerase [Actinomycetia bacterium]|nr:protein-disulfide isomerase [Actinomycetes bacterium]